MYEIIHGIIDDNYQRAYELQDGDIFGITTNSIDIHLKVKNNLFYEVIPTKQITWWGQMEWEETGLVFNQEQLNNLV
jgi:hypothetical protein